MKTFVYKRGNCHWLINLFKIRWFIFYIGNYYVENFWIKSFYLYPDDKKFGDLHIVLILVTNRKISVISE